MCGIAGVFQYKDSFDARGCAESLTRALAHRGPDDAGIAHDPRNRCLLVHRRLAIIDPTDAGHQPMSDESGRYTIVLNGEIYNYQEIRQELKAAGQRFISNTDTEALLYAYRQWGEGCLTRLRGMFAFAVLDRDPQGPVLFLARDRFGIKPLVYAQNENGFVFSSELRALVGAGLVAPDISLEALGQYLAAGSVQQPNTIYQNVFQLMPGHCLTVSAKGIADQSWYDVRAQAVLLHASYKDVDAKTLADVTGQRLDQATRYHIISDVEVGAFLSGGVDSAAVVALMKKYVEKPIKTFSIGFESQSEVNDELAAAHATAQFLGTRHSGVVIRDDDVPDIFEKFIPALDQPSVDGFNTFLVSRAAGRCVKVVLSGLGGDELFGGYNYFYDILRGMGWRFSFPLEKWGFADRVPLRILKMFSYRGQTPYRAVHHFRQYHSCDWIKKTTDISLGRLFDSGGDDPRLDLIARMGLAELNGYLNSTLLRDCDNLSMARSLEVRPVLLDHELVEHALALPDRVKYDGRRKKAVLCDAVSDLIPPECRQRKKSGFELPFCSWLKGPLNKELIGVFSTENARALFQPRYYERTAQRIGKGSISRQDWQWFILLRWLDERRIDLKRIL